MLLFYLPSQESAVPQLSEKEGHKKGAEHEHQGEQCSVGLVEQGLPDLWMVRVKDTCPWQAGGVASHQRVLLKHL